VCASQSLGPFFTKETGIKDKTPSITIELKSYTQFPLKIRILLLKTLNQEKLQFYPNFYHRNSTFIAAEALTELDAFGRRCGFLSYRSSAVFEIIT